MPVLIVRLHNGGVFEFNVTKGEAQVALQGLRRGTGTMRINGSMGNPDVTFRIADIADARVGR